MFAATANQFAEEISRDFWWLRAGRWVIHPDRDNEPGWRLARWLLWPLAFLATLIYAQVLPFLLDRTLTPLFEKLPWITDRELLGRIENLFSVCHEVLRVVGPLSIWRSKTRYWLEELDEQLDTLEFVRLHGEELDESIAQLRAHHAQRESA